MQAVWNSAYKLVSKVLYPIVIWHRKSKTWPHNQMYLLTVATTPNTLSPLRLSAHACPLQPLTLKPDIRGQQKFQAKYSTPLYACLQQKSTWCNVMKRPTMYLNTIHVNVNPIPQSHTPAHHHHFWYWFGVYFLSNSIVLLTIEFPLRICPI